MFKAAEANSIDELFYTPEELAKVTKLHIATIRKMFMDEPDVMRLGHAAMGRRRQYFTLRIPARVAARVLSRMTVRPSEERSAGAPR